MQDGGRARYDRFGLVLAVTHDCTLRCDYCYMGRPSPRAMSAATGEGAIEAALRQVVSGGVLELGFFGGEPLLEARLVGRLLTCARQRAAERGIAVEAALTTNGTVTTPEAWLVMADRDVALAVSFDGLPAVHDRHRRFPDGRGSSEVVLQTLQRLVDTARDVRVVLVVRPDSVDALPDALRFLRDRGVRSMEPSLDLWTRWSRDDMARLERAIARGADVWGDSLPDLSVSWFDEKAAGLAGLPLPKCARCGFGRGEIAVAPSGRLYPCERLIGEDRPVPAEQAAVTSLECAPPRREPAAESDGCAGCSIRRLCNTFCRCSNYVRTGRVDRPDRLLCVLNRACVRETARVLRARCTPLRPRVGAGSLALGRQAP